MTTIVDYPGMGEIVDAQGNILVITDQDALVNAINLWICSFRSERLYKPYEGGIIALHLFKPMSEDRVQMIKDDLIDGLTYKFNPNIKVHECLVVPDYDRKTYWITIKGYCPALQISFYDNIGVKVQI